MDDKKISIAVIRRLPRYYRYLGELLYNGVTRISSRELSKKMNVTASQIRQDLNNFGGFGQQGYGYNVEFLHSEIKKILGITKNYNLVIIGAGNLGQALTNYQNFEKSGFFIRGMFDINPKTIGLSIRGIEVYEYDSLKDFIEEHDIDIAVLSLTKNNAVSVANDLVEWGIRAIWNFSPADLNFSSSNKVVIENVHLTDSLITLAYRMNYNSGGF